MNYIGCDSNGNKLQIGDICMFVLDNEVQIREGIIVYDEDTFAYCFEMEDNTFPIILMNKTKLGTIQKIINVWSTKIDDKQYEWCRKLFN